jgi:spore coat protein U-like protein
LAQTATDTLTVTANVAATARITSVGNIVFGNYDTTDPVNLDADGSVSVRATNGLPYEIYIGADRTMTSGPNNLLYELYSDAARTLVWGSASGSGVSYTSITNAVQTYNIYGRVAALQDVVIGAYSDTVTITMEW